MKKIIPYIAFACLIGMTATNNLNTYAGGCSNHMNKSAKTECEEKDKECLQKNSDKNKFQKAIKS